MLNLGSKHVLNLGSISKISIGVAFQYFCARYSFSGNFSRHTARIDSEGMMKTEIEKTNHCQVMGSSSVNVC